MTASGQETTVRDLLPCQSVFLEISPVQKYRGSFPLSVIACTIIITIVATSTVTIVILMLLGRSNGPLQEVTTVVEKQSSTGAVAVGVVLH